MAKKPTTPPKGKKPAAKKATRKRAKPRTRTPAPAQPAEMRTPAHGHGQLRSGNPGNKGSNGRPPNELRAALRADLDTARAMLRARLDGAVLVLDDGVPVSTLADRDLINALKCLAEYGMGRERTLKVDARAALAVLLGVPPETLPEP